MNQKEAARVLLELGHSERMALLNDTETDDLDAAERAKFHPLKANKFSHQELTALRAHLLDGGGVVDDTKLLRTVLQAVLDEDWTTVFQQIPHVLKSWFKQKGAVTGGEGQVVLQGFSVTPGLDRPHSGRGIRNV